MVRRGHHVVLYIPESPPGGTKARRQISRHFNLEPAFEVACGLATPFSHDALIATHYTTAHFVAQHASRAHLCAYFVQDFEPYFFPIGAEYFDAERTYRYPFYCVTVGEWLADRMRRDYGREADSISFWADRSLYFPRPGGEPGGPLRVAFLARPDMPRRCYPLGVQALALFKRARPSAQVLFFGARDLPHHQTGFDVTNLGVLPKRDLADLYRSAHIGLAFSTTNPSLVPIEMMACGLPVVDIDVLGRREREVDSPAVLAEPTAEAVAEALGRLADSRTERIQLRHAGVAYTDKLPAPGEAFAQISRLIEARIERQ
jgi:glycosyltransferase involved in cell wall biosynthesis